MSLLNVALAFGTGLFMLVMLLTMGAPNWAAVGIAGLAANVEYVACYLIDVRREIKTLREAIDE